MNFVLVRLMGLAGTRGWVAGANPSDGILAGATAPPPPTEPTPGLHSFTLIEISTTSTIYSSLPSHPALLIFNRHSDPGLPTEKLGEGEGWTGADMSGLEEAVELADCS
ncbi:hypothetical protein BDP27DRAFT_1422827 [Rhodocollybia butyracea]|uniref:Secreted protein n=1 Tax=Rhodocollybia butyracea TaxID=206335 RepID=A0A9P5PQI6_9AGAR|nr:hypothetical protein BDP27DRAFT_1422827 [Rhodocollybia butyracea]